MIKMQIESVRIGDITPYENNPRHNDNAVAGVKASIEQFGFKIPMVIDKNNVIVCGHTRYKAAKELGMAEVPCIRADELTDDQIKAFRLADNKVAEAATWDIEKLDIELDEIQMDMSEFGFEMSDIDPVDDGSGYGIDSSSEFDDVEKLERHYGVPYQGNKSRIADIIINILPSGERLVDLFGGGGAITHCGMLSGKWGGVLIQRYKPSYHNAFHGCRERCLS